MATALRYTNPARLDAIVGYAAHAAQRAVPGPAKRYAKIVGVSERRARAHLAGDPHSPSCRFLVQLASADSATAWSHIAEGIAIVTQEEISKASTAALRNRLNVLDDLEHDFQSEEDRQTMRALANATPAQLEAAALANIREAECQLERAALLRELARPERRKS